MNMNKERHYIITYDIAQQKRWRQVFNTMKGYGDWLQLSVFECRLSSRRYSEMLTDLEALIDISEDHVLIFDLGRFNRVKPSIVSLGKTYTLPTRGPVIV